MQNMYIINRNKNKVTTYIWLPLTELGYRTDEKYLQIIADTKIAATTGWQTHSHVDLRVALAKTQPPRGSYSRNIPKGDGPEN